MIGTNVHFGILQDVLYVPVIVVNPFSIGKATDRGITAVFKKESAHLYRGEKLELVGRRAEKDLYQLNFQAVPPTTSQPSTIAGKIFTAFPSISLYIWHIRFGHAQHAVI